MKFHRQRTQTIKKTTSKPWHSKSLNPKKRSSIEDKLKENKPLPSLQQISKTKFSKNYLKSSLKFNNVHSRNPITLETAEQTIPWFIIGPDSIYLRIWDLCQMGLLLYSSIFTTFKIGFINDSVYPAWDIFDDMVNYFFLADVVANFFKASYDDNGVLLVNVKAIALRYLRRDFTFDFISSFPLYDIISLQRFNNVTRLARITKLYKLIRLIKLTRVIKMLRLTQYNLSTGPKRIIQSTLLFFFAIHLIACFWYLINDITDSGNISAQLEEYSLYEQYVWSLYWTINTMLTVGFGPGGRNAYTYVFATVNMIISVYIMSFTVGSRVSHLTQTSKFELINRKRQATLNRIYYEYIIPPQLARKLNRAVSENIAITQNENSFLEALPQQHRVELGIIIHQQLRQLEFFSQLPDALIAAIGPLLSTVRCQPNDRIFINGDIAEEVYFIIKGKVAYVLQNQFKFMFVKQGHLFGDVDLLFYGDKRKYTAIATKETEMYTLSRKSFRDIFLSQFREIGSLLVNLAEDKKNQLKNSYFQALSFCHSESEKNQSLNIFTKSVNTVSSNEQNGRKYLIKQKTMIKEADEDQEWENEYQDAMMSMQEREKYIKQINDLENQLQIKNKTIESIQNELDNLIKSITNQKKNRVQDFIQSQTEAKFKQYLQNK